jgi:drug/metabolite transporter (DMT)-like permease
MASQRAKVALAFAAVYIIWGSTYLAIRFVIESLPPFFMAGTRFVIAGLILYIWARFHGKAHESALHWRSAFVVGGFMLLGGHGAVVWAEQWIPSGLTSLLVATVPLWIVFLYSMRSRVRPNITIIGGLVLGFAGVALLISDVQGLGANQTDFVGGAVVVFGTLLWASGSLYSPQPSFLHLSRWQLQWK